MKFNLTDAFYKNTVRVLMAGWILFSALSLIVIKPALLTDLFVIISIIMRVVTAGAVFWFYREIFRNDRKDKRFYTFFKSFTGYGITLTYVSYSLPLVVEGFYFDEGLIFLRPLLLLVTTVFPALLYLVVASRRGRIAVGFFTLKEIEAAKLIKKDKVKRKAQHKKLKGQRNFLQNLWFEWIDPLLFAIIAVMLVHNFIFQMFEIPSESMVPTFLKKDRVIASHFDYGSYLPLTNIRLPAVGTPETGDIVTFVNPAVDDPNSGLGYKNVFTSVFQPFFYMLTFSLVDIDSKPDGTPKERLLVKRILAEPGDKICMVNDDVYKKRADSDWELMERGAENGDFGDESLFWDENPGMDYQKINRSVRTLLDQAAFTVRGTEPEEIRTELSDAADNFRINIEDKDAGELIARADGFLIDNFNMADQISGAAYQYLNYGSYLNTTDLGVLQKEEHMANLENTISVYRFVTYYDMIEEFSGYLEEWSADDDFFDREIVSALNIKPDDDPFEIFMKKLNALYKLNKLKLYTAFLSPETDLRFEAVGSNPEFAGIVENLFLLDVYLNGFKPPEKYSGSRRISYFDEGNLPEYPAGKDNYIEDKEYFMAGDNRYNSLDSRFSRGTRKEYFLDSDDRTELGSSVSVMWQPHSIKWKYIKGKLRTIVFPFKRFRFF